MVKVLLDIGASSRVFAKHFHLSNPSQSYTILCGSERFEGEWSGLRESGHSAMIHASYSAFNVPDASLDIVTLNDCDHLLCVDDFAGELVRTLKSGGFFISAHKGGLHPHFKENVLIPMSFYVPIDSHALSIVSDLEFEQHVEELWSWTATIVLSPQKRIIHYPPSPTILDRLVMLRKERLVACMGSIENLCASLDVAPTLKIWKRR
jgi:SAM-dependent methyltransferase